MAYHELIETLWNVNLLSRQAIRRFLLELIETLWNVNTSAAEEPSGDAQGINRNIVECKLFLRKIPSALTT